MGDMVMKEEHVGISLDELVARLPAQEREAVRARTTELLAREMSLRDLRKALGRTQVALAHELGIKQENVSRIEQRSDMMLSTLNSYLRGMGGRLRLVAEFKGRPPVELSGFSGMADAAMPARRKASRPGKNRREEPDPP